ncbi:hypothetical protein MHEL_32750 [Mycolicibacterium helvum]|uniref:Arsenate reductase n=1 Tax=Mycolicibacterium helvum TaxID=1534349 RepID=A0A7I7T700_9MYCO|nr:hypothetical protein MHEL_32750 [Mycolicibacterium helvum]
MLFVCVKNGGKSRMATGLMRKIAGHSVDVHPAGTKPGGQINTYEVLGRIDAAWVKRQNLKKIPAQLDSQPRQDRGVCSSRLTRRHQHHM